MSEASWLDPLKLRSTFVASDFWSRNETADALKFACAAAGVDECLFDGFQIKTSPWLPVGIAVVFDAEGTPHVIDLGQRK